MNAQRRTVQEWEADLGDQVRAARLAGNIDMATLAERANISTRTLSNLEHGRGSSLSTLIKVARALGRHDWLDGFHVAPQVSPLELMRQQRAADADHRKRASPKRPSDG